jgi:hypothetical protein
VKLNPEKLELKGTYKIKQEIWNTDINPFIQGLQNQKQKIMFSGHQEFLIGDMRRRRLIGDKCHRLFSSSRPSLGGRTIPG